MLLLADAAGALIVNMVAFLGGLGTFIFVFVGYLLFSAGWDSYEERFVDGAERSVEDLFLTIPPQQMLWLSVLGTFGFFALVFVASGSMILGAFAGVLGFYSPKIALRMQKTKRQNKFGEQLTDALITLTNALRSGFALPKAFQLIAQDMPKPICQEFGILVQELRLGIETEEGLANMYHRVPSVDLDLVKTSVGIAAEVGGNLAEVFDRIAFTIRERRRIEGRIDSLTAQGKIQGLMVALIPILMMVAINFIDENMLTPLFTTVYGYVTLGVMAIMEGLGYFLVRKITTIEV
ncbi:MAG: type II secretion system F family protein [Planctomycetes bacterium]|nr:type II secretion system F family protein [Planctomycetota bacterium]